MIQGTWVPAAPPSGACTCPADRPPTWVPAPAATPCAGPPCPAWRPARWVPANVF